MSLSLNAFLQITIKTGFVLDPLNVLLTLNIFRCPWKFLQISEIVH